MAIGVVTEVGAAVTEFRVGERVFGHLPIRETHTVEAGRVDLLPAGLTPPAAVCLDPLVMALPMREGNVRLGDRVAVFGLGAIGQMAVQLARLAGADQVIAVDPIKARRDLALALGADAALDPLAGDVGQAIRELTAPAGRQHEPAAPFRTSWVATPSGPRNGASAGWMLRSRSAAIPPRCTRPSAPRGSVAPSA